MPRGKLFFLLLAGVIAFIVEPMATDARFVSSIRELRDGDPNPPVCPTKKCVYEGSECSKSWIDQTSCGPGEKCCANGLKCSHGICKFNNFGEKCKTDSDCFWGEREKSSETQPKCVRSNCVPTLYPGDQCDSHTGPACVTNNCTHGICQPLAFHSNCSTGFQGDLDFCGFDAFCASNKSQWQCEPRIALYQPCSNHYECVHGSACISNHSYQSKTCVPLFSLPENSTCDDRAPDYAIDQCQPGLECMKYSDYYAAKCLRPRPVVNSFPRCNPYSYTDCRYCFCLTGRGNWLCYDTLIQGSPCVPEFQALLSCQFSHRCLEASPLLPGACLYDHCSAELDSLTQCFLPFESALLPTCRAVFDASHLSYKQNSRYSLSTLIAVSTVSAIIFSLCLAGAAWFGYRAYKQRSESYVVCDDDSEPTLTIDNSDQEEK